MIMMNSEAKAWQEDMHGFEPVHTIVFAMNIGRFLDIYLPT
jgi:hypothetical protein